MNRFLLMPRNNILLPISDRCNFQHCLVNSKFQLKGRSQRFAVQEQVWYGKLCKIQEAVNRKCKLELEQNTLLAFWKDLDLLVESSIRSWDKVTLSATSACVCFAT